MIPIKQNFTFEYPAFYGFLVNEKRNKLRKATMCKLYEEDGFKRIYVYLLFKISRMRHTDKTSNLITFNLLI